jgi:hypothetical protein
VAGDSRRGSVIASSSYEASLHNKFSRLKGRTQRANSGEVVQLSSGKVVAHPAPGGDEQDALLTVPVASPVRVQRQGTSGSRSGS